MGLLDASSRPAQYPHQIISFEAEGEDVFWAPTPRADRSITVRWHDASNMSNVG